MPHCAAVDSGAAPRAVYGNMRYHPAAPQFTDEIGDVIGFVSAQRDAPTRAAAVEHGQCGLALGCAGGVGERAVHHQTIAILRQRMPHIAKLGGLAAALAVQLGSRVGARGMCLVRALLAPKILLGIAARLRRGRLVTLPLIQIVALQAG
jgi:hypothetical protein